MESEGIRDAIVEVLMQAARLVKSKIQLSDKRDRFGMPLNSTN